MTFSMTTSIPLCGRRQRTGSGQSWYVGYMVTVGHLVIVLLTWYLVTGYCNVLSHGTGSGQSIYVGYLVTVDCCLSGDCCLSVDWVSCDWLL